MSIELTPIAHVRGGRTEVIDDNWGAVQASIELDAGQFTKDAIAGLGTFSHLVVVYHFHKVALDKIETSARHPRGNTAWPKIGIFAQRGKNRPNRLGVSTCRILSLVCLQALILGLTLQREPHFTR